MPRSDARTQAAVIREPRAHSVVVQGLWRAAGAERLPHALLFSGRRGTGRYLSALWFAQGLFCETGPDAPCGTCGPCKRVATGNHPDLFLIDAVAEGEQSIKVGRIAHREESGSEAKLPSAEEFLTLRAAEGGWRVVVIREAQRMTEQAQNALLKTLEEPAPRTLLILESDRPDLFLPTTISRCVEVPFGALPPADTEAVLAELGLGGDSTARLARWSSGSPGEALRLVREGVLEVRALAVAVLLGKLDPIGAAAALWELEGDFPGKTPTVQARVRARAAIELVLALLRDVERFAAGLPPGALAHGDLGPELERMAAAGRPGLVRRQLETVLRARLDLDGNLQPEAVVTRVFLALAEGARVESPA